MAKQRIGIQKAVREQILKEYNHRCAMCREVENPEIHHIDEDPSNNDIFNLIPLCPNCHTNKVHNAILPIDRGKLRLFRRYRNLLILAPQFHPLYLRLQFLNDIKDDADVKDLQGQVGELIRLVKAQKKGDFYAGEIGRLLALHPFVASYSVRTWIGNSRPRPPQWYIDRKNQERPKYRQQLREARDRVYELIIESLTYQDWQKPE